jgi:hypothetical protein
MSDRFPTRQYWNQQQKVDKCDGLGLSATKGEVYEDKTSPGKDLTQRRSGVEHPTACRPSKGPRANRVLTGSIDLFEMKFHKDGESILALALVLSLICVAASHGFFSNLQAPQTNGKMKLQSLHDVWSPVIHQVGQARSSLISLVFKPRLCRKKRKLLCATQFGFYR